MTLSRRRLLQTGAAVLPAVALGARPAAAAAAGAAAIPTTGVVPAALSGFDTAMKTYIAERAISSAQLAVAKNGKILLARGYGSYQRAGATVNVQPTSLFRIASLSKSLTGAALARLAQDGKVSLGAKVSDLLGLSTTADPRLANVTLWRLLQHTGGWDRGVSKDPLWIDHTIAASLGVALPIGHADITKYVTARPLDFAPGSKYVYSNYGYMLAGRVIEKVSGMSYEAYVRDTLLAPVKITRMLLGQSVEPFATEVNYESQYTNKSVVDGSGATVPYPYGGFNMPNQDANGGWLASAVDLVKWGFVFDAAGPVLNGTSISRVFAKPETGVTAGGSWYGLGWHVRTNNLGTLNTWHNGSMPGTFSFLARIQNGVSYCAIFNRREETGTPDYDSIDPILGQASSGVTTWPTTDLTSRYF
ncbi:beta-lactamase family protein [Nonomuraea sp. MG754425]|uniref:serine hydrolase domain-containing protein n=1 Tax=Nonomuraea sp. MG754425 TaxID=2570319 RepID=UPI001F38D801|nr:serine hydrolase domain-containing protein [Nonomuraea sp. MG754425]MCF6468916.1 beta-lactamase family protein [Nonomuraea sp. MG754425]